jgi:hypothetical protein
MTETVATPRISVHFSAKRGDHPDAQANFRAHTMIFAMALGCLTCATDPKPTAEPVQSANPDHPINVKLVDRDGTGTLRYLGWDQRPKTGLRPGQAVAITHYFHVDTPVGRDLTLFLHGETPESGRIVLNDHLVGSGSGGTQSWKKSQTWRVRQVFRLPPEAQGKKIDLFTGLFHASKRLTVWGAPGQSDGRDRIRMGTLTMEGYKPAQKPRPPATPGSDLPLVTIPKTTKTITADGKLDESAWSKAPILEFSDSLGREVPTKFKTKLRLLYDDVNLYVSFEADDQDISCPFSKRDDPIYDHEAVEVFIMPQVKAPALGPYIELQASPKGILFDAAFTARRTGMDTSFNAGQIVGTVMNGTLNVDDGKDRGFVSEWIVPFSKMRGVQSPPKPKDEWRMNAFRIEKYRQGGQWAGEYTAWSPPRVGDFHNVNQFGRMIFGP